MPRLAGCHTRVLAGVIAPFRTSPHRRPIRRANRVRVRVRLEAQKRGLILLTCGVYGNVVRFLAPITIPEAHFTEALGILEASVAAARAG